MEFILDTVDLEEIKDGVDHMPIVGVTSNPSIVKKTSPEDFFGHMRKVREIIGKERSLHVQVISLDAETIVKEAHRILEEIDDQVYIKVPVSYEGLKAIKNLKKEGFKVTATAVYTSIQAYLAAEAGADYVAPYLNRIDNLGYDGIQTACDIHDIFENNVSAHLSPQFIYIILSQENCLHHLHLQILHTAPYSSASL